MPLYEQSISISHDYVDEGFDTEDQDLEPVTEASDIDYPFVIEELDSVNTLGVKGIAIDSGSSVNGGVFTAGTIYPECGANWNIYDQYNVEEGRLYFNTSPCAKDHDGFFVGINYNGAVQGLIFDSSGPGSSFTYLDGGNIPDTDYFPSTPSFGGGGLVFTRNYAFLSSTGVSLAPEKAHATDNMCQFTCVPGPGATAPVGADLTITEVEGVDNHIRTLRGDQKRPWWEPCYFTPGGDSNLTNQFTFIEYVWLLQEGTNPIEIFAIGETAVVPDRIGCKITAAVRYHNDYGYSIVTTANQISDDYLNTQWNGYCIAESNPRTIVAAE